MNKESALAALRTINARVEACTLSDAASDIAECLEEASKELIKAVAGDVYAHQRANVLAVFVRAGFADKTPKSMSFRQDILAAVRTLYSYVARRPDSNV